MNLHMESGRKIESPEASPEQRMASAKETAARLKSYGGLLGTVGNMAEKNLGRMEKINTFAQMAQKAYNAGRPDRVDKMYIGGTQLEKMGALKATTERLQGMSDAQLKKVLADPDRGRLERGCAKKALEQPVQEKSVDTGKQAETEKNEQLQEGKYCPIEGHDGHWEGERGNSKWIPDKDFVPQKQNPEQRNWGEILNEYGIDGISFEDGEPNFSDISKGNVEIEDFSTDRSDNFDQADMKLAEQRGCTPEEVAKWRKENRYTWHECKDMKTMQKVPSIVHNNITHSGGVSKAKKESGAA